METSGDHDSHQAHSYHYAQEHHHQESFPRRTESISRKRHTSGSMKRMSLTSGTNRKKLLAPLKDEDLNKAINDRYWGITLPAKTENLINDGGFLEDFGDFCNGNLSTPPSPVTFDYHSEENCLKCFNYLDTPETGFNFGKL